MNKPRPIDLPQLHEAIKKVSIASQRAISALSSESFLEKLVEAQALWEKQREEERWRNDPLELKDKLLGLIRFFSSFIANGFRSIADIIDP